MYGVPCSILALLGGAVRVSCLASLGTLGSPLCGLSSAVAPNFLACSFVDEHGLAGCSLPRTVAHPPHPRPAREVRDATVERPYPGGRRAPSPPGAQVRPPSTSRPHPPCMLLLIRLRRAPARRWLLSRTAHTHEAVRPVNTPQHAAHRTRTRPPTAPRPRRAAAAQAPLGGRHLRRGTWSKGPYGGRRIK